MSKTQFIDFKAVKETVTMEQIIDHYGLAERFKRSGENLSGPCPLHNGTNPTQFRVSLAKNCWNCFSQCRGGNVIDFVARKENVEFRDAAGLICDWFNLRTEKPKRQAPEAVNRARQEATVPSPSKSQEPTINKPLGFALKDLEPNHPYLATRGLVPETTSEFGIGFFTGSKGLMVGRVAIPIHNRSAQLVGYGGRWPGDPPDEETGKYKFPPGFKKSWELFNLHRAAQADQSSPLVIVEGFFGCLKLWQAGVRRVVSVMGNTVSEQQEQQILTLVKPDQRITLVFDEDKAGREGRGQALKRFASKAHVRVVEFSKEDMQPDQLTVEEIDSLALKEQAVGYKVKEARFPLGRLVATPNALGRIPDQEIFAAIHRHVRGDWGEVDEDDRQANESALVDGSRLFSVYRSIDGVKFYIITEADRAVTTVLLPEDY